MLRAGVYDATRARSGKTMKFFLFPRKRRERNIAALYGAIVAQARHPSLYSIYGVPDTINGRFDMIVLHLALLLDRIAAEPASVRALGQDVFDLFCSDMDDHLREMGVGDLAVPRKMRRVAEAFYGRHAAYRAAIASDDTHALEAALSRNVFSGPSNGAGPLATYMRDAARWLAAQDAAEVVAARLAWPDPNAISGPKGVEGQRQ
jgi:cytochrome b pre-mRNA-processing protein 3